MFRDGRSLCNNEDYSFTFYVNEQTHYLLSQYVFEDVDNIKIIFGEPISETTSVDEYGLIVDSENIETSQIACGTGTESVNGICQVVQTEEKSSKGGGCLIATATYGSELAPQVQNLRELRDNQLLQTESGTLFMTTFNDVYYSFSPIIADYERENPVFREMSKLFDEILRDLGMYLGVPAVVIVGFRKIKSK